MHSNNTSLDNRLPPQLPNIIHPNLSTVSSAAARMGGWHLPLGIDEQHVPVPLGAFGAWQAVGWHEIYLPYWKFLMASRILFGYLGSMLVAWKYLMHLPLNISHLNLKVVHAPCMRHIPTHGSTSMCPNIYDTQTHTRSKKCVCVCVSCVYTIFILKIKT